MASSACLFHMWCRYTLRGLAAAAAAGPGSMWPAEVTTLCDGRGRGAELFDLPRLNPTNYMRPYKCALLAGLGLGWSWRASLCVGAGVQTQRAGAGRGLHPSEA